MSEQIQPQRLRELRDNAIRYIHVNGAGRPKGEVSIATLRDELGVTDAEYKPLYILLHDDRLARTNGMNTHIGLTDIGRLEAIKITPRVDISHVAGEKISAVRLRQLRDQVIRYVHEHGAGNWGWGVPQKEVQQALGITEHELRTVIVLLMEQNLLPDHGSISDVGLNERGQDEAARLGSLPMQEPPRTQMTIHANYSIVQFGGSNSTQNAQLSVDQSTISAILNQIERELPELPLEATKREEAVGILATLRKIIVEKLPAAGARVLSAALASILTDAGSQLGKRLLDALGISSG
jgi:hypothetical protein